MSTYLILTYSYLILPYFSRQEVLRYCTCWRWWSLLLFLEAKGLPPGEYQRYVPPSSDLLCRHVCSFNLPPPSSTVCAVMCVHSTYLLPLLLCVPTCVFTQLTSGLFYLVVPLCVLIQLTSVLKHIYSALFYVRSSTQYCIFSSFSSGGGCERPCADQETKVWRYWITKTLYL